MSARWLILLALFPAAAHAAGFAIDEQDAEATGRGGTAAARAEASSAYYNPAGLAGVGELEVKLGATGIAPSGGASLGSTQTQANGAFYLPPYLYAAGRRGRFGFGLAVNAPFGLGVSWPGDFPARYEVESASFQTLSVMGSFAVQLAEPIALGISLGALHTTFSLSRALDFVSQQGEADLQASGWGFGAIAGLRYTVGDVAAVGFSASLPTPTSLSGTARFHDTPLEVGPLTNDQDIATHVTLPARLRAGASFRVKPRVRLDVDVTYTLWSSFDTLEIQFSDPNTPSARQTKGWRNGLTAHGGVEVGLEGIADLRGGIAYDQGVAPASTLGPDAPDGDRMQFSVGAGRELWNGLRADLAYAFLYQFPRTSEDPNYPAEFTGSAHMIALALSYRISEPTR